MKNTRMRLGAALVAVSALGLSACEPAVQAPAETAAAAGTSQDAEETTDASASSAGADDEGTTGDAAASDDPVAAASAQVEQVSQPVAEFTPPGPAIAGVADLAGGTVYYIPATLQVPMFGNVRDSLTEALGAVDVSVQTCDGKANPADIAGCLSQAVNAGADAIIAGSIPTELAATAFQSVEDAGIPLLYMQTAPAGPGDPTKVGYLTPNYVEMQAWNASWVVADSDGAANVLVVKVTDTPATILWIEQGALATYDELCPDCTVSVVETNTGQLDKLPSLVSSALVRDPDIGYVHVAFDVTVQPTIQGLQSAGRNDVKVVSQDGVLPVMQSLGQGQFMAAEVGFNQEALAWYGADQALRMMAGQESVQELAFPYRRLFTRDDAAGLELTPEGEASGEWFGDTGYTDGFLELWGVSGR
jgi:ribose transport system substrate-binding protein